MRSPPRPARAWRAADAVRGGVQGILGGVRAPAPLDALMRRQEQLARKLDAAVNQTRRNRPRRLRGAD